MAKKTVVFDFDGTVADTFSTIVRIGNSLSNKFGYKKVKEKNLNILRDKELRDILKDLDVPMIKLPFILRKVKSELNKSVEFLKPTANIKEVLVKLKSSGYKLGILTSNSKENVKKFLIKNKLDIFYFIHTESNLFGKDRAIKNMLRNKRLNPQEVIYIGDEVRDIKAAKKMNIKVVAVSWGFNSKQILEKYSPDFLISRPEELLKLSPLLSLT